MATRVAVTPRVTGPSERPRPSQRVGSEAAPGRFDDLLPILAVRMYGLAWLCLPTLATLSYLPHLNGPGAADYEIPGTSISYRVVEFGIFGLLLIVDRLRHRQMFPTQAAEDVDLTWQVESESKSYAEEGVPAFELV